ncbi:TetR/AcrR family transcriptional regulator [bacterium]|nr:TetR/AcrR family transcriptional regulator [bacterium]
MKKEKVVNRGDKISQADDGVRKAIFDAAVKIFARKGYHGTTIRDIVEAAGVTQPMVYYYFGSKEQLFITCVKELFVQLAAEYESIDRNQPFKDFLFEFVRAGSEMYRKNPESILLIVNYIHFPEEYPRFADIKDYGLRSMQLLAEVMAEAKERGEVNPEIEEKYAALTVLGAVSFAGTLHFISDNIVDIGISDSIWHIKEQIFKIIAYGLLER